MDCLMRRLMQNAFALHRSIANRNKSMFNAKHDPFKITPHRIDARIVRRTISVNCLRDINRSHSDPQLAFRNFLTLGNRTI
jgi:hypothetical protein